MPDKRKRSMMLVAQLARLRETQLDGQRAALKAAERDADKALRGLDRLDAEIRALDERARGLAEHAQAFHACSVLAHARYRAARTDMRSTALETYQASLARAGREREAALQLLAERDVLETRRERLRACLQRDAQRQEGRELDDLVSAHRARSKGQAC